MTQRSPGDGIARRKWLVAFLTTFSMSALAGVVIGYVGWPSIGPLRATALAVLATIALTLIGSLSAMRPPGSPGFADRGGDRPPDARPD